MSIFSKVPKRKQKRNEFNLSYANQFSGKTGILYPIYAEEVCPGDIFYAGTGVVVRSQPLLAPLFTNYEAEIRYFYVPNRIVWDGFKEFLMNQKENAPGVVDPKRVHPYVDPDPADDDDIGIGTIYDFFNVPSHYRGHINALPLRAYNLIYNEYFRDQNLQNVADLSKGDGEDPVNYYKLQRVCWKKDYFTSALPWTQRGEEVDLPALVKLRQFDELDSDTPFQKLVVPMPPTNNWAPAQWLNDYGTVATAGVLKNIDPAHVGESQTGEHGGGALGYMSHFKSQIAQSNTAFAWLDPNDTLGVNINIRDLRFATAVQRFLEKEAQVGGGRYADFIRGIYGVNIGDSTLQRPLYLGGGRQTINISPIEQTSSTDDVSPQGTLAGKGYMSSLFRMNRPTLLAEHGWVIGMMFIRPRALYYRGINRHMIKNDRFDYLIPGFQNLGEQEIYNEELYALSYNASASSARIKEVLDANKDTFGYTSRQAEYKSHAGEIHGELKSSLHQYVVARDFADNVQNPIPLNSSLVTCDPDEETVFAVSPYVADSWIIDGFNIGKVQRDLEKYPKYGL